MGKFSEMIFDKPIDSITIDDVKNFFKEPQEETATLEFKSGEADVMDLYKEIAAFLNTEGGLLIVGSPRESKTTIGDRKQVRICQGDLTSSQLKKESLQHKIGSNIVPSPSGITIKQLTDNTCNIFVIEVAQSLYPPHQCPNGVYYIRIDNEAKAAPHGLVQALFNQRRTPKIAAVIALELTDSLKYKIDLALMNVTYYPVDKGSFIVEVYNAHSVAPYNRFNRIKVGNPETTSCFQYNGHIDRLLTKGIPYIETFQVTCAGDFLIIIAHWSMQTTTCLEYYWIRNEKIIERFEDSEITGTADILKRFENYVLSEFKK